MFFSFAISCWFFPLSACKSGSAAADLSSSLSSLQAAPDLGLNVFHLCLIGSPHQEYSLSSPFLDRTGERSWPNVFSCRSVYLQYTDSSHLHLQDASQAADQKIKSFLLITQTGAQRLIGPLNSEPPLHLHWRSSLFFGFVFFFFVSSSWLHPICDVARWYVLQNDRLVLPVAWICFCYLGICKGCPQLAINKKKKKKRTPLK